MANQLLLAGAGAGKSRKIVNDASVKSANGEKVLLLTYTINNQKELTDRLGRNTSANLKNVTVKGWFSFLLEDMIRPYQSCIFKKRIDNVNFNNSDPNKKGKFTIPGRQQLLSNGECNPNHYLTKCHSKAHTMHLSKLALNVSKSSDNKPIKRLSKMFDAVYIDEVQDLVGYDYEILSRLAKYSEIDLHCVGDFRQTIYRTSLATKDPVSNSKKLNCFKRMGFEKVELNTNYRSVQSICTISDVVHQQSGLFNSTESKLEAIPQKFNCHIGVFSVKAKDVFAYIEEYSPTILRVSRSSGVRYCLNSTAYNFGKAKGLGFDRVLIIPTRKQIEFLFDGRDSFANDKTEEARNKFYVALTRAKYSVAILYDGDRNANNISIWQNSNC